MRDVLTGIAPWLAARDDFVLATVVAASGGSPRELGAAMAVRVVDGEAVEVVGSISGGCVEAAVCEAAAGILAGRTPRLDVYGLADAEAVGLTCGGTLSVFIEPGFPELAEIAAAIGRGEPVTLSTVVAGAPGSPGRHRIRMDAGDEISRGETAADEAEDEVFVTTFAAPPRLIVLGALDHAAALATLGRFLGYRVTVCDARALFATPARFPDAHEVVVDWPHRYLAATRVDERTAICVLTHDPRFDVPALDIALRSPAGYVGAMGSRRTCEDRVARLREAGLTDGDLHRLAAPIGLDLGASTPQETAVSIAAELIAHRHQGTGIALSRSDGPIHR